MEFVKKLGLFICAVPAIIALFLFVGIAAAIDFFKSFPEPPLDTPTGNADSE